MKISLRISLVIALLVVSSAWADSNLRSLRRVSSLSSVNTAKVSVMHSDARTDTIAYDEGRLDYITILPDRWHDGYLNVRFTPNFAPFWIVGALVCLDSVSVEFGGPIGTPDMRVVLFQSGQQGIENGYPTDPMDSILIKFHDLHFNVDTTGKRIFNFVDFRKKNIGFNQAIDFHIAVNLVADSTNDKLAVFSDSVGTDEDIGRSGLLNGSDTTWVKLKDIYDSGGDWAIRAIITDTRDDAWVVSPYDPVPIPLSAFLGNIYPNPFNNRSRAQFSVPIGVPYQMALFDPLGRQSQLVTSGIGNGRGFVSFDADRLTGGVYFLRLWTPYGQQSQRVVLLK